MAGGEQDAMSAPRVGRILAAAVLLLAARIGTAAAESLPRRAVLGAGVVDKDGVRINFIRPKSAADRAGLQLDDVVLAIGGHTVGTSADSVASVKSRATGTPVDFRSGAARSSQARCLRSTAPRTSSPPRRITAGSSTS
jgi:S1-C subfamily serine protease